MENFKIRLNNIVNEDDRWKQVGCVFQTGTAPCRLDGWLAGFLHQPLSSLGLYILILKDWVIWSDPHLLKDAEVVSVVVISEIQHTFFSILSDPVQPSQPICHSPRFVLRSHILGRHSGCGERNRTHNTIRYKTARNELQKSLVTSPEIKLSLESVRHLRKHQKPLTNFVYENTLERTHKIPIPLSRPY